MKKFLVLALALGLCMAFAMPAAAADVKFSGSYYIQGTYADNPSLLNKNTSSSVGTGATGGDPTWGVNSYNSNDPRNNRGAYSAYVQRLRLETEIKVVEGLSLKTRIDAIEKQWGDQTWTSAADAYNRYSTGGGKAFAQENMEWEEVFMDFKTAIGQFQVGYQPMTNFGTSFLYTAGSDAGIRWQLDKGPVTGFAKITKKKAKYNNYGNYGGTNQIANDADADVYELGGIGRFGAGEAGLMLQYWRDATSRRVEAASTTLIVPNTNVGYQLQAYMVNPYTKFKIGNNFYLEAEAYYRFGNLRKYEDWGAITSQPDVQLAVYGAYANARFDLKPMYVGAQFVMISGDDMNNIDKVTGSTSALFIENKGFNKTLILWNSMYHDSTGNAYGNQTASAGYVNPRTGAAYAPGAYMDNVWFYQAYVGVKPMAKLDLKASVSYANADKKPKLCVGSTGVACTAATGGSGVVGQTNVEYAGSSYGTELDLTAAYSIYDNLTYTIGGGYLWAGDYFKGFDSSVQVKDNYILMHNLTLAF
ncbi:MAG: hypothetical protein PHN75_06375 [Syntrophales bacterium]|nr:hypothetical protein [Syntrophales bacterium]